MDLLDGEDAGVGSLLELKYLGVGGAVLEVHDGPDSLRTGDIAGLEERYKIFHVGNLSVAVVRPDGGVVTGRRGLGVGIHGGDYCAGPKCRGVRDGGIGGVEDLCEGDAADHCAGADELGVLEGLHAALVDDVVGGQVLLLIRRCLWIRGLGERGVGGRHNFLLRGGDADEQRQ